jgi:hypothetical protein
MVSGVIALLGLVLSVAVLLIPGGVLFALFLFGLFLFGLAGVFVGTEDATVRQRGGVLDDPRRWRNGS